MREPPYRGNLAKIKIMSQAFVFESTSLPWSSLWEQYVDASTAIAVWRRPQADKRYFLADSTGGAPVENLDLSHFSPGFLVAPFIGKPLFFKAEKIFMSDVPEKKVHALAGFKPFKQSPKRADFEYWVQASIEQIKQGNFQKVVLSRTDEAPLEADFSVMSSFESLCVEYPNAFVCAIYEPRSQQIWLCATPEILVSQDAEGIFKTISLAGTQSAILPDGQIISSQDARWSQKEIEEQAFVSRYIIECFKKIRLREYIENGPKTIKAGNLLHLKTEYWVDTKALNYASLPGVMLDLLHPTSAVCGTPKEAAIAWISQAEKHERGFYSGYLGPVNVDHEIHLFVNLRTVKIQKNSDGYAATYYAGCGITEDSDPEKEWMETEMKCQTLQRVLNINASV